MPHLHPLFIQKEYITIFADYYTFTAKEFMQSVRIFNISEIKYPNLFKYLNENNFEKVDKVLNYKEFSLRGDILTVWLVGYSSPVRFEFFDEEIEEVYLVDEVYLKKLKSLTAIILGGVKGKEDLGSIHINFPEKRDDLETIKEEVDVIIFANTTNNIQLEDYSLTNTDYHFPQLFYSRLDLFEKEANRLENIGYKVLIQTKNIKLLGANLKSYTKGDLKEGLLQKVKEFELPAGLISHTEKIAVFTDRELFGTIFLSRPERLKRSTSNIKRLLKQFEGNIEIGDYVVHEDYGLGIYSGLTQEMIDGQMMEYLSVKYDKDDQLFVPINQIEKLTKYIGNEGHEPRITRLGGVSWENIKKKIKRSAHILARELLEHYAKRDLSKAIPIPQNDSKDYLQFVSEFKFIETDDQLRSINEIIDDLEKEVPMDRLLVGDVGFGKTEVFMRAAFKVYENGGQIAILSPTTVLASQHFETFKERFKSFPIKINVVSRFNTTKVNSKIIEEANKGNLDILIGTHRLLSSDVKFKNLGLVIVDEEQRFGVKQKEKIKQLNYQAHLLSVSATPIPRSLSMALSTIQEISLITTPPEGRQAIQTEIIKDDWNKVARAIEFEIERGGQIFFLHNKIQNMGFIKDKITHLIPKIRIAEAHGQMNPDKLDKIMDEFYHQKYDILLSTTIIENGLDIPSVNTIIINNAHQFGLSQLYQLRGRVGRSKTKSFCYLLYKGSDLNSLQAEAKSEYSLKSTNSKLKNSKKYLERLNSLVENQDLGAGFKIASKDLEIRGAGNLLGEQQSGHISSIGYALYIELLAQEVEKVRDELAVNNV